MTYIYDPAAFLKYANLQMAAEAFLVDDNGNPLSSDRDRYITALETGNNHASRFPDTLAADFADHWSVVAQKPNTTTGFSGTLFKNRFTDELVLSFRSTEFADDAARDNKATNELEIADHGWAFGQIDDMEKWYAKLSAEGGPLNGKPFSVTGYSLGGHLATAFNLLHPGAASLVVTFNGAGVGGINGYGALDNSAGQAALANLMAGFHALRNRTDLIDQFTTDLGKATYQKLKDLQAANGGKASDALVSLINSEWFLHTDNGQIINVSQAALDADKALLTQAATRAAKVAQTAATVPGLSSGDANSPNPASVLHSAVAANVADYADYEGVAA